MFGQVLSAVLSVMKEVQKGLSGRHPIAAKPAEVYIALFKVLLKRHRLSKSLGAGL